MGRATSREAGLLRLIKHTLDCNDGPEGCLECLAAAEVVKSGSHGIDEDAMRMRDDSELAARVLPAARGLVRSIAKARSPGGGALMLEDVEVALLALATEIGEALPRPRRRLVDRPTTAA